MARVVLRRAAAAATAPKPHPFSSSSSSSVAPVSVNPRPPRSAVDERLVRLLRSEIAYLAEHCPPSLPPNSFKSFAVEHRPGEQWVRLRARRGAEDVKVEATMVDGAAVPPLDAPLFQRVESLQRGPRLHLSFVVEVSRPAPAASGGGDRVLGFVCSAWPDAVEVRHVLPLRQSGCRDFRKLEEGDRKVVKKYLEEREVDGELAEFLHDYMANKEKMELLRWLMTVESFIEK